MTDKRGEDKDERTHDGRPESGLPESEAARRDEVGRTGVYPASGPLPPGDAEARGMGSWGQGDPGGQGYQEAGGSEVWFTEQELKQIQDGLRDQMREGMGVIDPYGGHLGTVEELRENDFLLHRDARHDVYVPYDACRTVVKDHVMIGVTAEDVDKQGWDVPERSGTHP